MASGRMQWPRATLPVGWYEHLSKCVGEWLFPLHEKLKGHQTIHIHKQLEQSQWFAPAEIAELQLQSLRSFLARIAKLCPTTKTVCRAWFSS